MTLLQLMRLVVFAAVASLCLAPFGRMAEAGIVPWTFVLMGAAVGIPLVLAVVALLIVRTSPARDRSVRGLLLFSVISAAAISGHPLLGPSPLWSTGVPKVTFVMALTFLAVPAGLLLRLLRNA